MLYNVAMKSKFRRLIAAALEQRVKKLITLKNLKVVAITGSVGKTSTKMAIATVLAQKYKVLAHPGNYNSEIGLPLSIFELEVPGNLTNPISWVGILRQIDRKIAGYKYEVLVLEMGADQPGDIQKFMRYIKPDIGVITAIAPAHVEQFGSIEAIAEEKMALAHGSRSVWLNEENERVMAEAKKLPGGVRAYGVEKGNVHFTDIKRGPGLQLEGKLEIDGESLAIRTRFITKHNLSALAVAGGIGEALGLEPRQIRAGLENVMPFAGRMQVLLGISGSIVLDDTYNSSPLATVAALNALYELPGRKIAILGNMNELGDMAEKAHREVGEAAAKVDLLVTIGDLAGKYIAAGASQEGLEAGSIKSFNSPYAAGSFVRSILKEGDIVLAKGSQNRVFAEEAVALLLKDESDRLKLVRQSAAWKKIKAEQFEDAV